MTRTRVWYALALLIGALAPLAWWPLAEPISQASDNMTAIVALPALAVLALVLVSLATSGVQWRHRVAGVILAVAGLAAWVVWAMNQPITRLF